MQTKQYSSDQVCDTTVCQAFVCGATSKEARKKAYGTAGRVVSGLLKAAANRDEIKVSRSHGRVTGSSVWYSLTDEQLASIRAEAIKRAA